MADKYSFTVPSGTDYSEFYTGGMDPRKPFVAEPGSLPSSYNSNGIQVETVNPDGSPANPGIARVTPEGLDVRNVRTVSIDPVTGNPVSPQVQTVVDAMSGGGSAYRGGWGSDAFSDGDVRVAAAAPSPEYTVDATNPLDASRLGLGYGNGESTNPGVAAITRALTTAPAYNAGTWGSAGLSPRDFLSGDPGVTDWTVANQGGAGILGPSNAPSDLPANPPPTAYQAAPPAAIAPAQVAAVHAALMAKQQLQSPGAQAALAAGKSAYVVAGGNSGLSKRGRNGNALGENALTPTRAMDGSVRFSYGD